MIDNSLLGNTAKKLLNQVTIILGSVSKAMSEKQFDNRNINQAIARIGAELHGAEDLDEVIIEEYEALVKQVQSARIEMMSDEECEEILRKFEVDM